MEITTNKNFQVKIVGEEYFCAVFSFTFSEITCSVEFTDLSTVSYSKCERLLEAIKNNTLYVLYFSCSNGESTISTGNGKTTFITSKVGRGGSEMNICIGNEDAYPLIKKMIKEVNWKE